MSQVRRYADVNLIGFSNFLEIAAQKRRLDKLILSSSVTVYGEGAYSCPRHGLSFPESRTPEQIQRRSWELICGVKDGTSSCGQPLTPVATAENKPTKPLSVYAVTKLAQEGLALAVSRASRLSVTVLRYFNVYGPRQALSNPYTGVAKIFASELAQGNRPVIYEDGGQMRDFVHVSDVVQANLLALESDAARGEIFNVGTGLSTKVGELADAIRAIFGTSVSLEASGTYRPGDVRHCWADISKIRKVLGFSPKICFPMGLKDGLAWPGTNCGRLAT
jgi:dTDP-L-rhamnose 4-epimerase